MQENVLCILQSSFWNSEPNLSNPKIHAEFTRPLYPRRWATFTYFIVVSMPHLGTVVMPKGVRQTYLLFQLTVTTLLFPLLSLL